MRHPTETDASEGGRRLLAHRRHAEILERLAEDGSVSVADLAAQFHVSRETIRRDLKQLAERGALSLIHGGAARFTASEPTLGARSVVNAAGKAAIGRAAAGLVEDSMVVLLDSGTTALAVAEALSARRDLTICTPAPAIALRLCHLPGFRVFLLGGEVDPAEEAVTGPDAIEALRHLRVDVAFIGAGGLSPAGEVTDFTRSGAEQRARMIEAAASAWFVAGHEKFGRLTPMRIAGSDRAGLIVDHAPGDAAAAALAARGQRLVVAGV